MQVSYRGIAYETQVPTIETLETQEVGLFLGNRFPIRRCTAKQQHSTSVHLRYRGVDYNR